jgi:hypothetical protein
MLLSMVTFKWQNSESRCVTKVVETKYSGLSVAKFGIKVCDKGSEDEVWWPISGKVWN